MDTLKMVLAIYFVLINIVTFICYGSDKRKAIKGKWRIPEATLIGLGFFGGGIGGLLGMKVFHHKTQKTKFKVAVPVSVVLNIVIVLVVAFG